MYHKITLEREGDSFSFCVSLSFSFLFLSPFSLSLSLYVSLSLSFSLSLSLSLCLMRAILQHFRVCGCSNSVISLGSFDYSASNITWYFLFGTSVRDLAWLCGYAIPLTLFGSFSVFVSVSPLVV